MTKPVVIIVDPGCFTPAYDRTLAGSLQRAGWNVELITSENDFERIVPVPGVPTRRLFPGSFRRRNWPGSRFARRLHRAAGYPIGLLRLDRRLRGGPPGILHVQWSHVPWLELFFWRRWLRAGWKVVYTMHDVRPLAGTTPQAFAGAYARLAARANAVVVHYEAARLDLITMGVDAARVHVISSGAPNPDDSAPAHGRAPARRSLGLGPEAPVVLFFGFVKPYKGLEILLASLPAVCAGVPDVTLVVAGEIVGSPARYKRLAARLGVGGAIRWRAGFVPSSDVGDLFAAADVVVLPYIDGSWSGVLLTAYAFRRPVVASAVGGIPELVEHGTTGLLVPPGDPAALAAALAAVLGDRARAEQMGNCGHALLQRRHTWHEAVIRLDALYRELAV